MPKMPIDPEDQPDEDHNEAHRGVRKPRRDGDPTGGPERRGLRQLPEAMEALAGGETDRLRRPRGPRNHVHDERERVVIAAVNNRDARHVFDARVASLKAEEDPATRGRALLEAVLLQLWRARALTGFDAFATDMVGIPVDEAHALLDAAAAESGIAAEPLPQAQAALWLRTESAIREHLEGGEVTVRPGDEGLELCLRAPLGDIHQAVAGLAGVGRQAAGLARHLERDPAAAERSPEPRDDDRGPRHDDRAPRHDDRAPRHDDRAPRHDNRGPQRDSRNDNRGHRYDDRGPRSDDRGPRRDFRGPRDDNRGPRHDDRGPRRDFRGPRDDNRGPRNDNRGPRDDNRGPRYDDRGPKRDFRGPRDDDQPRRDDNRGSGHSTPRRQGSSRPQPRKDGYRSGPTRGPRDSRATRGGFGARGGSGRKTKGRP